MKLLQSDDLSHFIAGSQLRVLSSSGALPASLELWAQEMVSRHGGVELVHPSEVPSRFDVDEYGCCIGGFGSLTAMYEMPPRGDEITRAFEELERFTGRRFTFVAALNSGGFGALLAVVASAILRLPLLDGDGQGRIIPRIDQTTYALAGLNAAPLVTIGPWGDTIIIDSPAHRGETVGRAVLSGAGGWLISALYPASARGLASASIPGSMTDNITVGKIISSGQGHLSANIAREVGGRIIARGRVLAITRSSGQHSESLVQLGERFTIHLENISGSSDQVLLEINNEIVMALVNGGVVGTVPDTICLLDPLRVQPVDVIDLQIEDVIDVLLLPAHEKWRTPEGLRIAGLEAFGYPQID